MLQGVASDHPRLKLSGSGVALMLWPVAAEDLLRATGRWKWTGVAEHPSQGGFMAGTLPQNDDAERLRQPIDRFNSALITVQNVVVDETRRVRKCSPISAAQLHKLSSRFFDFGARAPSLPKIFWLERER
jgi:hypothetical protein